MPPRKTLPSKPAIANVACPVCASPLRLTSQLRGRSIRCLSCRSVLSVEASPAVRGKKAPRITLSVVVSPTPCPLCAASLDLVPELHGGRIRCAACLGIVAVSTRPWKLTPVSKGSTPSAKQVEPAAEAPAAGKKGPVSAEGKVAALRAALARDQEPDVRKEKPGPGKASSSDSGLPAEAQPSTTHQDHPAATNGRAHGPQPKPGHELVPRPDRSESASLAVDKASASLNVDTKAADTSLDEGASRAVEPASSKEFFRGAKGDTTGDASRAVEPASSKEAKPEENASSLKDPAAPSSEEAPPPDAPSSSDEGEPVSSPSADVAATPAPKPVEGPETRAARKPQRSPKPSGGSASGPILWSLVSFTIRIGVLIALVAGLIAGGQWFWGLLSGPVHPETRYMPDGCSSFVSLRWSELAKTGVTEAKGPLPGLGLANRCRIFLKNAGIPSDRVERVNVGARPDGSMMVIYRLNQPVEDDQVMMQPAFREWRTVRGKKETIRGVPVYVLTTTAVAFPDPQTIINGETPLVRSALTQRPASFSTTFRELIPALDFSLATLTVTEGVPRTVLESYLQGSTDAAKLVVATTDGHQYGDPLRFVRTFHFGDSAAGDEFRQALHGALGAAAKQRNTPKNVRQVLESVEITAAGQEVEMTLTLPKSQATEKTLETLSRLF